MAKIRHFVLLQFRTDVTPEQKDRVFADLKALSDLDGVIGFHGGANVSVETDLIRGNNDAFWFDFASGKARDAYLVHPRHQAVGASIVALTEGGIDGVTVCDIELKD